MELRDQRQTAARKEVLANIKADTTLFTVRTFVHSMHIAFISVSKTYNMAVLLSDQKLVIMDLLLLYFVICVTVLINTYPKLH